MFNVTFQEATIALIMMILVGILIGMSIGYHIWYKPEDHRDISMRREWFS